MARISPVPRLQFFDDNGDPLVGGKLYTYAAGTETPLVTYTDAGGGTPHTNPIILNSRGEVSLWLGTSLYDFVLHDANDAPVYTAENIGATATYADLVASNISFSITNGPSGTVQNALDGLIRERTATEISAGVTPTNYYYEPGNILRYGADPTGTLDSTTAVQNAVNCNKYVFVPEGVYKTTATIDVPAAVFVYGVGRVSRFDVYGCDGFEITGGSGDGVGFWNLAMLSYTSGGTPDPRLYTAVYCHGTAGNTVNNFLARDMYLQGWNGNIYWAYTASSSMENIYTINAEYGLVYYGQSVNNTMSNCKLVCNAGQASVKIIPDGATVGEGLMISNSLLASGAYGIDSGTGFFSLEVSNCIVDLIGSIGINVTDAKDLKVANTFIYAAGNCIKMNDLGVEVGQDASISNCSLKLSGSSGTAIDIGLNNLGVNVTGNSFELSGTEVGVTVGGKHCNVANNYFENTGSGASISVTANTETHNIGPNTGTVTYSGYSTWTPSDGSGASLSFTVTGTPRYVRNGKQCTCALDITFPVTANGSLTKVSLPFVTDAINLVGNVGYTDYGSDLFVQTVGGEQYFRFMAPQGTFLTNANMSGKRATITFNYITS